MQTLGLLVTLCVEVFVSKLHEQLHRIGDTAIKNVERCNFQIMCFEFQTDKRVDSAKLACLHVAHTHEMCPLRQLVQLYSPMQNAMCRGGLAKSEAINELFIVIVDINVCCAGSFKNWAYFRM